jgi:flagellar M-ring protein FliF
MLDQFTKLWRELGINQKVSLLFAIFGIVVVTIGLLVWAGRSKMQLLYGGLDSKDMADVSKSVESLGVKFEIRNGGASIYVESSEVYHVRMRLAADGIPSGGGVGYEIFDSGSFGVSSFVQHTNFVRAIQGELARTINQLDGVNSSKVMIVIPENELLINGPIKKPTASVFVDTGARTLGIDAVDSIRSLVSNSVEGMNPNDVAVVDNRGNVISAALQDEGAVGMSSGQVKYRKSLEDYYTKKVETMLAKVVGNDNVVVRVSVGLDMDMQTLVEEQYDPNIQVVRNENTSENQLVSTETVKTGVAGEQANVLGGEANASEDSVRSNSNESKKVKDTTYEISKTTIETVKNPGGIRSLNAAVFLALQFVDNGQGVLEPSPRTTEQLDRIRQMVVNALGIEYETQEDLARRVTIEETEFKKNNFFDGSGSTFTSLPDIIDLLKSILAIGISIFMLMFFFRMIKNSSGSGSQMEVLPPDEDGRIGLAKDINSNISPELLNELIKQNPDKISSALKNWAFPDQ